jgi:hypothetical protein
VVPLASEMALEYVCVGSVEVHPTTCVSGVHSDALQCHFRKDGIRLYRFDKS